MKRNIKRLAILLLCLLLSVLSVFSVGCGCNDSDDDGDGGTTNNTTNNKQDSSVIKPNNSVLDKDEGMVIDGKNDEECYGTPLSFVETNTGVKVTTYAYIGEKGLYLYSEVDDKSVYFTDEKQFYENDTIEYYIDPRPDYSKSLAGLMGDSGQTDYNGPKVRKDCLQLRLNCLGDYQTWYGRMISYSKANGENYPWVRGYFNVETAGTIDGTLNVSNGAEGYTVEAYIPWTEFSWDGFELDGVPTKVGVMPAFNNVHNREDTSRSWFSVKGMSHPFPSSYAVVDQTGFADMGYNTQLAHELTATANDSFYDNPSFSWGMSQVNGTGNGNVKERARIRAKMGTDAVYFLAEVKDVNKVNGNSQVWDNDGIEIVMNVTSNTSWTAVQGHTGIYRLILDVDGGTETTICKDNYTPEFDTVGDINRDNGFVRVRYGVQSKIRVIEGADFTEANNTYGYTCKYVYEIAIPYSSFGLTDKPNLSFSWAIRTPDEKAYIYNRGEQDGWLWIDGRHAHNPSEYYVVETGHEDVTPDPDTPPVNPPVNPPQTTNWSLNPNRYTFDAKIYTNKIEISMKQYVNSYVANNGQQLWDTATHVEFEIWCGSAEGSAPSKDIYCAIWSDGSYYNNGIDQGYYASGNVVTTGNVVDRGAGYDGYRYCIEYTMTINFTYTASHPAYIKFMSFTPNETTGYETSTTITKDGTRTLWTDNCESYKVTNEGIVYRMGV